MNAVIWTPQHPESTHLWQFMRFAEEAHQQQFSDYQALHAWSLEYPALFWQCLCDYFHITFTTHPKNILNLKTPKHLTPNQTPNAKTPKS